MQPADRALITLIAAATAWDLASLEDETLSQAVRRHAREHRGITYALIFYLAVHLSGLLSQRFDPLSRTSQWIEEGWKRWTTRWRRGSSPVGRSG